MIINQNHPYFPEFLQVTIIAFSSKFVLISFEYVCLAFVIGTKSFVSNFYDDNFFNSESFLDDLPNNIN